MIRVAFINESSVVTGPDLGACVAALQIQVSRDFAPVYGMDAQLFVPPSKPPYAAPDAWQIVIGDDSDQLDAAGYHELTPGGAPLGKVFAKADREAGSSWTVTASHELLEMLADPWACLCAQGPDGTIRAFESSDAVEDDQFGYRINGVLVSDFVFPSWFDGSPAPFDFCKQVTAAGQTLTGGYIAVLDPSKGWNQVFGERGPTMRAEIRPGSRRWKRLQGGRRNWRPSVPSVAA